MTTSSGRTVHFAELADAEHSNNLKPLEANFKGLEKIDFSDPKYFPQLAQFVLGEVQEKHCQDLTRLKPFTFSKEIQENILNRGPSETLRKIILNEKKVVQSELYNHLETIWKNYGDKEKPELSTKALQDKSWQRVVAEIKKEQELSEEEVETLAKDYAQFFEKTDENIIHANHSEYSRLITQLKLKIKKKLAENKNQEKDNKADLTIFKSIADENLLEELKKMGVDLKQGKANIQQTTPGLSLNHQDLVAMTLDKLENRLPLEFYVDTYLVSSCIQRLCFAGVESIGMAGNLAALVSILMMAYHNRKDEQQQITDAIIANIKENKIAINPDEIKIAIKVPKAKEAKGSEEKGETIIKKLSLLDKPYRDQILKANEALNKVDEKESEEHARFNPFHHCLR